MWFPSEIIYLICVSLNLQNLFFFKEQFIFGHVCYIVCHFTVKLPSSFPPTISTNCWLHKQNLHQCSCEHQQSAWVIIKFSQHLNDNSCEDDKSKQNSSTPLVGSKHFIFFYINQISKLLSCQQYHQTSSSYENVLDTILDNFC